MAKDHVRQHFVPECYLERFRFSKGNGLSIYDKALGRPHIQSIDNTCELDCFYDLNDPNLVEYIKKEYPADDSADDIDSKFIEKEFFAHGIESEWKKILEGFDIVTDEYLRTEGLSFDFDEEDKYVIASYIIVQYLRTPSRRNNCMASIEQFKEEIKRKLAPSETSNLKLPFDYMDDTMTHIMLNICNPKLIEALTKLLAEQYWTFHISPEGEFYTSDNPIAIYKHVDDPYRRGAFYTYGSELSFPLTDRLCLTIWEKNYFEDRKCVDGTVQLADDDYISREQLLQYYNAHRIVISKLQDFSIIENVIKKSEQ